MPLLSRRFLEGVNGCEEKSVWSKVFIERREFFSLLTRKYIFLKSDYQFLDVTLLF